MSGPLFPVGFEVLIERHVGLLAPDAAPAPGRSFRPIHCCIEGIRLDAEIGEEWDEAADETRRTVSFEKGWRYFIVTTTGSVWGWEYEADLLAAGYMPPQSTDSKREATETATA